VADEQPRGLTVYAVCLLAALALGLAFAGSLLTPERAPEAGTTMSSAPRGPALQLKMAGAATVPALRPQAPPRRRAVRRPHRRVAPARRVAPLARVAPTPPAPVQVQVQVSTPTPRPVPVPTPRPVVPVRRPVAPPKPTPTAIPEPAGEFDTTGTP
jgi:hypothetical protein